MVIVEAHETSVGGLAGLGVANPLPLPKTSRLAGGVQDHFRVETRKHDRATVVLIASGELDLASSPALDEELRRIGESDVEFVIVDLRELEFIDSSGLTVLVKASQRAAEAGKRFALVQGGQQGERLLSLTGVADHLTVVDTPEELLGGG